MGDNSRYRPRDENNLTPSEINRTYDSDIEDFSNSSGQYLDPMTVTKEAVKILKPVLALTSICHCL